jgi:hypothetical protein
METILYIIGAFVIGYAAGRWIATWMYIGSFVQILRDLNVSDERIQQLAESIEDETDPELDRPTTVIDMRVERHDNQLFAYRKDTGAFLSQAADGKSLIARLTQDAAAIRNDVKFRIADEDGAEYLK